MILSYPLRYGFQGMDPTWVRRSHEATLFRPPLESMPGEGAEYASFKRSPRTALLQDRI